VILYMHTFVKGHRFWHFFIVIELLVWIYKH
jgi:hypothetical protein